jgi:hypothetical protein
LYSAYAYYYEAAPASSDGAEVTILLVLLIIGFIVAIYWLATYSPLPPPQPNPVRPEVDKIFNDEKKNASSMNRPEAVYALDRAQQQVIDLLKKRDIA